MFLFRSAHPYVRFCSDVTPSVAVGTDVGFCCCRRLPARLPACLLFSFSITFFFLFSEFQQTEVSL